MGVTDASFLDPVMPPPYTLRAVARLFRSQILDFLPTPSPLPTTWHFTINIVNFGWPAFAPARSRSRSVRKSVDAGIVNCGSDGPGRSSCQVDAAIGPHLKRFPQLQRLVVSVQAAHIPNRRPEAISGHPILCQRVPTGGLVRHACSSLRPDERGTPSTRCFYATAGTGPAFDRGACLSTTSLES